ncbi:MAG TPA: DUF4291 domain-containing protein [Planctomycetia bacterium]|nr:DUF4291 domain-containing protein [Planctomycetia bacterium]
MTEYARNRSKFVTEPYREQVALWPESGRHVCAQFDDETIIVYQAYRTAIGRFAAENGRFGGEFSYSRMSWIKPNFLWMMFRSGWGTKEGQEVTLALRLRRTFFDSLLLHAVPSSWTPDSGLEQEEWSRAVAASDVRLQWDPDHGPRGEKLERRAIQLGLRGQTLEEFGGRELLEVTDISAFVEAQRRVLETTGVPNLTTPRERVYRPAIAEAAARLGLDDG